MMRVDAEGRDVTGLHGLHDGTDTVSLTGEEWDALTVADLAARLDSMEDLVRHCWVHSGHEDCGWKQMDGSMKRLYQEIIKPDCKLADAGEVK
jgi:hypothetical protein